MTIEWTEELETRDEFIDSQHREWISRYNAFLKSLKEGRGRDEVEALLRFLEEYTYEHFSAEEDLMTASGYGDVQRHRELHDRFRLSLKVIRNEFERLGAGLSLTLKANHLLGDWLRNHIMSRDKEMVSSLKR